MNLNNIQSGVVLTQDPLFTIAGRKEPMHRGVYVGILCFYAKLFDQMEIGGILDPLNELHPFCLHHIFLPRFNRSLKELVEQRIKGQYQQSIICPLSSCGQVACYKTSILLVCFDTMDLGLTTGEGITLEFALFQLQLIPLLIVVNTMAATSLKTYDKHRDLLTSES